MVLPSVLFGMEVVDFREEDIEKLQKQENAAMRRILRAPKYAAVAGIRGELGMGTMKSRIVRARLQYLRRKVQGDGRLMKQTIEDMRVNGRGWWRKTEKYLNWVGMDMGEVMGATGQEIKRRIAQRVELDWRREMEEKSTLWMYRRFRGEMEEEDYRGEERIGFGLELELIVYGWEIGIEKVI